TDSSDARSTRYASDLAKGYEIPIIRVNADDPIACVRAIGMADEYTKKLHKDCFLDLVGYCRYGHNEMYEPRATQPILYQEIDNHPTVTKVFGDVLKNEGIITADEIKEYEEKVQVELRDVYDGMKEDSMSGLAEPNMPEVLAGNIDNYETAVPLEELEKLNEDLLKRPEGFKVFKRLNRVFKRR